MKRAPVTILKYLKNIYSEKFSIVSFRKFDIMTLSL